MIKMQTTHLSKIVILNLLLAMGLLSCQNDKTKLRIEQQSNEYTTIRISSPEKYILLPVEEKAEEVELRVKAGNEDIVPIFVRLAQSHVDYYVPFRFPGNLSEATIEIINPTKNALLLDKIELSDTFDKTNREKFRPVYHHAPEYGWMNDPNGMVYLDGEYHLFYQWNPYGSMWGNLHWGHAVSKDLVNWEHLGMAIAPDDLGMVFSGNCVIDTENVTGFGKNAMIAFYTSAGEEQTQSIAYSTDKGRTFHKYEKNPVVSADIPDFRDPNVFYHEPTQKWIMVVAAGQEVQLFSSANLLDWEYESSFGEGYGNHGGVWECPDLMELPVDGDPTKTKWVLLLNINPGGIFGGSAAQYFTGDFDGKTFRCESTPETEKWMDWGKDHYATVSWWGAPQNRSIVIAWMSNWQYANQVPTQQFRSANSVPREIKLYTHNRETYLINEPVKELEKLRKNEVVLPEVVLDKYKPYNVESILENNQGAYELVINFNNISAEVFGLTLFNEKGENVDLYYNLSEKRFYMDRSKSGIINFSKDFPAITYAPVEKTTNYTLRIFVDKCSVECFDGDGKFVMTNLIFPEEPYNRMSFYSKGGKIDVASVHIYELGL